jgi:hypothetical protein
MSIPAGCTCCKWNWPAGGTRGGSTRDCGLPPAGAGLGGWMVAEAYQFLDVGVRQAIVTATAGG